MTDVRKAKVEGISQHIPKQSVSQEMNQESLQSSVGDRPMAPFGKQSNVVEQKGMM